MGCALSCLLGAAWCRAGCSAKRVAATFAFLPPRPASYSITHPSITSRPDNDDESTLRVVPSKGLAARSGGWSALCGKPAAAAWQAAEVRTVVSLSGHPVAMFRFAAPESGPARRRRLTLLHSHGNAADCGMLLDFLYFVSQTLGIGVCCYDYSGYGASGGEPGTDAVMRDVEAVYAALLGSGVDPAGIVPYGASVGSGPSCHIAATRRVAGVILHAGIASGLRVLSHPDWGLARRAACCAPSCCCACCDVFPNARLLRRVRGRVPVLLLHGTDDAVVAPRHAVTLHAAAGERAELHWVDGAGHDNVAEKDPEGYLAVLGDFLDSLVDPRESRAAVEESELSVGGGAV